MDKGTEILQKIAETGDCEFLDTDPCSKCPLARLKKRPDGSGWLSCFEAVGAPDFQDVRAKYKRAAEAKLIDLAIESAIDETKSVVD